MILRSTVKIWHLEWTASLSCTHTNTCAPAFRSGPPYQVIPEFIVCLPGHPRGLIQCLLLSQRIAFKIGCMVGRTFIASCMNDRLESIRQACSLQSGPLYLKCLEGSQLHSRSSLCLSVQTVPAAHHWSVGSKSAQLVCATVTYATAHLDLHLICWVSRSWSLDSCLA